MTDSCLIANAKNSELTGLNFRRFHEGKMQKFQAIATVMECSNLSDQLSDSPSNRCQIDRQIFSRVMCQKIRQGDDA